MNKLLGLTFMVLIATEISGCSHPQAESYFIPQGFNGRVNIVFNQPKGESSTFQSGRRVYQIPPNGILLTQFKDEYGFVDHQYYYVDKKGAKQPLPIFRYEYNKDGTIKWIIKDKYETGIFLDGTTGEYGSSNIKYQEFIVSNFETLDSFYLEKYKSDFAKELQNILHSKVNVDTLTVTN